MSQETPLETRKAVLEVMLANYRPEAQVQKISEELQHVASHINRSGFDFFVDDINAINDQLNIQPFIKSEIANSDFEGAVVNADIIDVTRFENAYGILPVSLNVGVPESSWSSLCEKFGVSKKMFCLTIPRRNLKGSAYGLERFGLGFYRIRSGPRIKDLINLQQAKWIYSPQSAKYECDFDDVEMNIKDISLWMEHRLMGDLAGSVRDDSLDDADIAKELTCLLDHFREGIIPYVIHHAKEEFDSKERYHEFVRGLSGHFRFYQDKIHRAVDSFMQIEEIIGKKNMPRLLFSLGGNYEVEKGNPYEITEDNVEELTSEQRVSIVKQAINYPFRHLEDLADCMQVLPPCAEEILDLSKAIGDDKNLLKNILSEDSKEYHQKLIMPRDIYAVLRGEMPKKRSYEKGSDSQKFSA